MKFWTWQVCDLWHVYRTLWLVTQKCDLWLYKSVVCDQSLCDMCCMCRNLFPVTYVYKSVTCGNKYAICHLYMQIYDMCTQICDLGHTIHDLWPTHISLWPRKHKSMTCDMCAQICDLWYVHPSPCPMTCALKYATYDTQVSDCDPCIQIYNCDPCT